MDQCSGTLTDHDLGVCVSVYVVFEGSAPVGGDCSFVSRLPGRE